MQDIQVTVDTKKKTLTIVAPLGEPTPSASGKTEVVASSRGNIRTDAKIADGRTITLGFNAYVAKE